METIHLTEADMASYFSDMEQKIRFNFNFDIKNSPLIYGVPRGGIVVAYRIAERMGFHLTDDIRIADIIVDDIVCSGKTRDKVMEEAKGDAQFFALIDACASGECKWYVFPWETTITGSADDIPVRLLEFIGEDPQRDGLKDTPKRFLKAWKFFTKGYQDDPKQILGTMFENEEGYDEMVILRDIEFYSMCEHHLVPFFGKVHIAYVPGDKVVGISKLARLVECFARRVQIQERMTAQIANAIQGNLHPQGVAVMVEAQHLCMVARGVEKQNSVMVTSSLKGCMAEPEARAEFLALQRRV